MIEGTVFSKDIVNTGRQKELDWAKACAIIAMVTVHVYEKTSVIDTETIYPTGAFRNIIEFVAGPLAAPLFMFAMGIGMVYARHHSAHDDFKRGLDLLKNGYLLNFFRAALPLFLGSLVGASLVMPPIAGLLYIDILEFAGFAFLTIALMKKLGMNAWQMLIAALVLQVAGYYLSNLYFEPEWLRYLLSPFLLTHKYTSFPMFLWLYYPVLGIVFGELLQHVKDKKKFYGRLVMIGAAGLAISLGIMYAAHIDVRTMYEVAEKIYYRQSLLHYLFTTSVIFIALGLYYVLSAKVTWHPLTAAVQYMSAHLNVIYIVQWLVICYFISFCTVLGLPAVPVACILPTAAVVLLVSVGITELYLRWKKKKQKPAVQK
ncbi:MAG: DUF1624 domain-containing protein [Solobacterium sp.]|nr:DUF1624 domain-containing protein [Solobacterium sp.]MCH4205849.1 DUF1624 domain-containing protein [Solobacterium sp.]MCH4227366.1 DUF1624 domain-containing protein [Solobacterium sp.]MCH4282637.1 DUF1624 domain-containing protein [Solobacterium sp.]